MIVPLFFAVNQIFPPMKNFSKSTVLLFIILAIVLHSCKKEELPTLSTSTITNISTTSASGGGNITSDGNAEITARGVCWGINENPTTSDSKTNDGNSIGQFVSNLTGLVAGSTYHIRAYATNSVGTAYGADLSFATLGKAPECMTQPATNITPIGATLNGTVNANYISTTVTFEYGTTSTYGQTITATQSPVTGNSLTNVNADLTGLVAGTTYHFRIKTVNSLGATNGNDLTFITAGQAPTAITQAACCLSSTGAKLNGTVNANYLSAAVTFEYGLTTAYGSTVTAIPSPVTGNTSKSVSAVISELNPGTTYHFRIKALNELGTTYGEDLSFTTIEVVPNITTTAVTDRTHTSAISGGNISSDGGSLVTGRGVCWTTMPNPTINGEHTTDGTGTGSFTSNMRCLSFATTYYVRAYANNSVGTAYGEEQSFTTLGTNPIIFNPDLTYGSVSDIDGNCYKTIQIGTQTWMAENLKTTKYTDGRSIPLVTDNSEWSNLTLDNLQFAGYCWYDNDINNKNTYGALYSGWLMVSENNGKLCPTGWHIPEISEWRTLITTVDLNEPEGEDPYDSPVAGGKLKEAGTTHWLNPNEGATNEFGFTALPGGHRKRDGFFSGMGSIGGWFRGGLANTTMSSFNSAVKWGEGVFELGYSIRCIKD